MTPTTNSGDEDWFVPRVDVWIEDTADGQTLLVSGQRPDGQWFTGSFFQPATDNEEDTPC